MKRPMVLLFVLLMVASSLGVSAEDKASSEISGKVVEWIFGDYENRLAEEFTKKYPNVDLEFVLLDAAEYGKKIQIAIASGGELPDLVNLEMASRGQLIDMDMWVNLEEAYGVKQSDYLDFILPKITSSAGKIVCLPIDNCVGCVFYRRDLARKYLGTDDPEKIEEMFPTWESYLEFAKTFKGTAEDGVYLFASAGDLLMPRVNAVIPKAVENNKLMVEKEYREALQYTLDMVNTGTVGKFEYESEGWFATMSMNNVLFYMEATWFVPDVLHQGDESWKGDWGVIKPPVGGYNIGGSALAIPKTSKNKDAAFAWLKFLSSDIDGAAAWRDINSVLSCYKPAYQIEGFYSKKDEWMAGQDAVAKLAEIVQGTERARPLTPYDSLIDNSFRQVAMKMLTATLTQDEAYQLFLDNLYEAAPELKQ